MSTDSTKAKVSLRFNEMEQFLCSWCRLISSHETSTLKLCTSIKTEFWGQYQKTQKSGIVLIFELVSYEHVMSRASRRTPINENSVPKLRFPQETKFGAMSRDLGIQEWCEFSMCFHRTSSYEIDTSNSVFLMGLSF